MYLDIRTMVIVLIVGGALSSAGMLLLGRRFSPNINGPSRFSRGLLFFFLGWALLGLRDRVPDFLSIVVGNMVLVYAAGVFYQAIRRFQEQEYHNYVTYGIMAAVGIGLSYYTYVEYSLAARTVISSFAISVLLIINSLALMRQQPKPISSSNVIMAVGFLLVALIMLGRAIFWVIPGNALDSLFTPAPSQDITYLGIFVGMMVILFGFVLVIHDKMNAHLKVLASHDALTGVYNRRSILEYLKTASAGSRRSKAALGIMMIDLDNFKQVNDTYGHLEGDVVLKNVVAVLASVLREQDSLGRYGGEEFLAVLPNTDVEGTIALAERMLAAVKWDTFQVADDTVKLTISIGVDATSEIGDGGDELLRRADDALLKAKKKGRDQIVVAE